MTGGFNMLRTGGESQTGIAGGLINMATGTRAGDTVSLVIQLAPEIYGVVALGKSALVTDTSKAQALKAADALDDAAFKRGNISERAPAGTERQVLQTPEVKAQTAAEATRKATAEAAETEAKASEIVVTGKRKGWPESVVAENSSVWKLGPGPRGEAIEQAFGHNLPGNFPVIDRFNNGIAISIKSIDLDGASYLTGNILKNMLTSYVDKVASFNGKTWADQVIRSNDIKGRALEIIVPHRGTAAQQATLNQIIKYGSEKGVTVDVIPYP